MRLLTEEGGADIVAIVELIAGRAQIVKLQQRVDQHLQLKTHQTSFPEIYIIYYRNQ